MSRFGLDHVALGLLGAMAIRSALGAPASDDMRIRADLEIVSKRWILFGHQSVGGNVLDGLAEVAAGHGGMLRILEVSGPAQANARTLTHAWVAANGAPHLKLEAFGHLVDATSEPGVDIALVKFCYADFTADTDASALFLRYREFLAGLQSRHPSTAFVHVTVPLTTVQGGPRAWVKGLMGKAPHGFLENARRDEYNALLRTEYAGREPLFDLAQIESTLPDGGRATASWRGRSVPALFPGYTDDGGHLNASGRLRAARELLAVLASTAVPDRSGAATGVSR